jgi:dTDP-4-dehydrorhamnose reductase
MENNKILLIGANGQVAWELLSCLQPLGDVVVASRNSSNYIDLAKADSIVAIIRKLQPNIIVNAAAYTAVDQAEQETELAAAINGTAPGILAEEAKRLQALLIHYSTDYVFNGNNTTAYIETDSVDPLGVYGSTKLAGEQAIQAIADKYLIFRTAWVYGLRGKNFLLTMQRLAKQRDELKIVADQIGAPTWSRLIAEATAQVIAQINSTLYKVDIETISGIYHLTCGGETNWYEFAKAILASSNTKILPINTVDYPTPAKRPAYSVLSNQKLINTFGIRLPDWNKALSVCLS